MLKVPGLHLAIDASNIRQGGGLTHLSQLLYAADPAASGIGRITVWASRATAASLPARSWLQLRSPSWIEAPMPLRGLGQQLRLNGELKRAGCHLLFSPGGTLPICRSVPTVTMSQNMLPFEPNEARRFGRWSAMRLKMWLLRQSQGRSLRRASGVIFLTKYAKESVAAFLGGITRPVALIPHGIERRFVQPPRAQLEMHQYSMTRPFRLLYVSILMPYKHQVEVALAVSQLRGEGLPIEMLFIGADWGGYGRKFRKLLQCLDPGQTYLRWPGGVPFGELDRHYREANAFVFASSCENLPNIMIEAMASGLPIASSNRGPMPEVLAEAGIYFDPENPDSIAAALRQLVQNVVSRSKLAAAAWEKSQAYSWEHCAADTFEFISRVALVHVPGHANLS